MGLASEGIDRVRARELPAGIWADGTYTPTPRVASVTWRSSLVDKLYQVYVNGQLAGVTVDTEQRQVLIQTPTSFQSAVRIEIYAVEPTDAHRDHSDDIDPPRADIGRVTLAVLRDQNLPYEGRLNIYGDNGTGTIDYDHPVNENRVRIWPSRWEKAGFGMAQFETADFGYDGAAAVGFGRGRFGLGQFGLDADVLTWTSPALPAGVYQFAIKTIDQHGNESAPTETAPVTVTPAARAAHELAVASFDRQTNQLKLVVGN